MIRKLGYVLSRKEKIYLVYLLLLVIIGSTLELLGVSVFMPFIEIITDPNKIFESDWLNFIYTTFYFKNSLRMLRNA